MVSIPGYVQIVYRVILENLALCRAGGSSDLAALLEAAVEERRPAVEQPPWLALPLLTCEALGGDPDPTYHVAAGLELGRMAAGCLDEWQDQDTDDALWKIIGPAQTVNLATAMIALSHLSISRLTELGQEPVLILSLHKEFSRTLLRMSEGQYADLAGGVALSNYAEVAARKSGSLLRLGCQAGAMVAGAQAEVVTYYGDFGQALGVLAQAWNDLYGTTGARGKRDLEYARTLPILAAPARDSKRYTPGSTEGQVGQLYALTQVQLLHQRAAEALARCPAPGGLGLFLDAYSFDRLRKVDPGQDNPEGGVHGP